MIDDMTGVSDITAINSALDSCPRFRSSVLRRTINRIPGDLDSRPLGARSHGDSWLMSEDQCTTRLDLGRGLVRSSANRAAETSGDPTGLPAFPGKTYCRSLRLGDHVLLGNVRTEGQWEHGRRCSRPDRSFAR